MVSIIKPRGARPRSATLTTTPRRNRQISDAGSIFIHVLVQHEPYCVAVTARRRIALRSTQAVYSIHMHRITSHILAHSPLAPLAPLHLPHLCTITKRCPDIHTPEYGHLTLSRRGPMHTFLFVPYTRLCSSSTRGDRCRHFRGALSLLPDHTVPVDSRSPSSRPAPSPTSPRPFPPDTVKASPCLSSPCSASPRLILLRLRLLLLRLALGITLLLALLLLPRRPPPYLLHHRVRSVRRRARLLVRVGLGG